MPLILNPRGVYFGMLRLAPQCLTLYGLDGVKYDDNTIHLPCCSNPTPEIVACWVEQFLVFVCHFSRR